jgi:hypothetical protein
MEKLDKVTPRSNELQGDTKDMPDRGTRTAVTDTYGAKIDGNATNRIGGMGSAAKSDGNMRSDK